jgi:hypothetical protein
MGEQVTFGKLKKYVTGHKTTLQQAELIPDSDLVASTAALSTFLIWRLSDMKIMHELNITKTMNVHTILGDQRRMLTSTNGTRIILEEWRTKTARKTIYSFWIPISPSRQAAKMLRTKQFSVASAGDGIKVLNLSNRKILKKIKGEKRRDALYTTQNYRYVIGVGVEIAVEWFDLFCGVMKIARQSNGGECLDAFSVPGDQRFGVWNDTGCFWIHDLKSASCSHNIRAQLDVLFSREITSASKDSLVLARGLSPESYVIDWNTGSVKSVSFEGGDLTSWIPMKLDKVTGFWFIKGSDIYHYAEVNGLE